MVLQQYVDGQDTGGPSLAQLNAELARSKESSPAAPLTESSALTRNVEAARRIAEQNKAFPVGTVLLARGGELFEDSKSERRSLLPRDGHVLDMQSYPALRPLPLPTPEPPAPTLPARTPESAAGEDISTLNIRDIALEGASEPAKDASAAVPPATGATGSEDVAAAPDFVSAYQRHRARPPSRYVHLVVLQHGFLGQAYDMHLIENAIRLDFPGMVEVSAVCFHPCTLQLISL